MLITTTNGSLYPFFVTDGTLRTTYEGREVIVTEIRNLEIGKILTVSGYLLSSYNPKNTGTVITFYTSPIKTIKP